MTTRPAASGGVLDALGQSLLHHLADDQLNVLLVRHGQPGLGPTATASWATR